MKRLRNAAWLMGSRTSADALGFLLFIAISRDFGPLGTGQYSYGFAVAGFIYVIANLGLDDYGVREFSRLDRETRRPILARLLGTQVVTAALTTCILAVYLLVTRASSEVTGIVVLLSIYQLAFAFAKTLFVPAYAHQEMAGPALAELACRGGATLSALVLVVGLHVPLRTALLGYPVAGVLLVLLATVSARRHHGALGIAMSRKALSSTLRAAWPFAASEVVFQLYARADLIILTLLMGEAAAGLYASGLKFIEAGVIPLSFLGVAAFPELSRLFQRDDRAFQASATDLLKGTLVLGGLVAWALYFVAPMLLVPLLGPRFTSAGAVVEAMAGLVLLFAVEIVLVRVLLAAHLQVWRLKLQAAGTVFNIVLNVLLIPHFGILGAVIASAIALATIDVLYLAAIRSRGIAGELMRPLGYFAAALVTAMIVAAIVDVPQFPAWLPAVASLAMFVLVAASTGLARMRNV